MTKLAPNHVPEQALMCSGWCDGWVSIGATAATKGKAMAPEESQDPDNILSKMCSYLFLQKAI